MNRHRLRLTLATCACALLALPAVAAARPATRSFTATYPVASVLCARVTAGHAPSRLSASVAQVAAACATLKSSFTAAQNAYATTVAPLRAQAVALVVAERATCKQDRAAHDNAACRLTRTQTRAQIAALRTQVRAAAATYRAAVGAARKTFWATIHALPGAGTLTTDPTHVPLPVTVLPAV